MSIVPTDLTSATLTASDIDAAAERISQVVATTELQYCARLSERIGASVYLKREDLQVVRSYKLRGAYNYMAQLSDAERAAGVITASAGNHAQGVAFACKAMQVVGRIYVPHQTPKQKIDRIKAHGGAFVEVIAQGENYDAAARLAAAEAQQTGATMVPPFDHPRTAAGQGTTAVEILAALPVAPDAIVVPIGGGGCISGIASYIRERSPHTAIVGCEPAGAPSMTAALNAGGVVELETIDPFVDGAAVRSVGQFTFSVVSRLNARPVTETDQRHEVSPGAFDVITVDEGAICTAMLGLYQSEGIIAEPAGALSVAALDQLSFAPGSSVVCLLSGGNNDVSRYNEIIERSLVHQGIKHYFLVAFAQEPGALRRFLDEVLGPDDDITLFEYVKRNNRETGEALVGVELGAADELGPLLERMDTSGLRCERLEPGSPAYRYLT